MTKYQYVVVSWIEEKNLVTYTLSSKTNALEKLGGYWLGIGKNDTNKETIIGRDLAVFILPKPLKNHDEFVKFLKENDKVMKNLGRAFKEFFRLRKKAEP